VVLASVVVDAAIGADSLPAAKLVLESTSVNNSTDQRSGIPR
jgi:hypothetical protein